MKDFKKEAEKILHGLMKKNVNVYAFVDLLYQLHLEGVREELQEIHNISCDLPENYMFGETGKLSAINTLIMKKLEGGEKNG